MRIFKIYCICLLVLNSFNLFSQNHPKQNIDFQEFITKIIGLPTDGSITDDQLEALGQLYLNPIDLNTSTKSELAALFILSDQEINAIFDHKIKNGAFVSTYELQAVTGLKPDNLAKILPFVTVIPSKLSKNWFLNQAKDMEQMVVFRNNQTLEQKKGYTPLVGKEKVRYLGSPGQFYVRYRVQNSKNFTAGFTLEKDDGEKWGFNFKQKKFLADFSSFHAQVNTQSILKKLHLGDYTMQFGQGLVAASGFYLGKGSETVLAVRRNSLGVRPYTSVIEGNFFRGAAANFGFKSIEASIFASRVSKSANLVISKTDSSRSISSIGTDGYHRTESEIADKNILKENMLGFQLAWNSKNQNLKIESLALFTHLDKPWIKANQPYNKYEFKGQNQHILGLNYSYYLQNFNFFGEIAQSQSKGTGMVHGLIWSLGKKLDLSAVYRKYDKNFHTFYGLGFGENSRNINEKGVYFGAKFSPSRKMIMAASYDIFKFPEIKFGVSSPSFGHEILGRIQLIPSKTESWSIQYRLQHKGDDQKIDKINVTKQAIRQNLTLNFDKKLNDTWAIGSTLVGNLFDHGILSQTKGWAIIQDTKFTKNRFKISHRIAYFDAKNYNNRIYAYENDVLYAFSFPAYYGRGLRNYMLFILKSGHGLNYQIRIARTNVFHEKTIGSGLELINKPHKTDLKMQILYQF